jgi:hypothetical protein
MRHPQRGGGGVCERAHTHNGGSGCVEEWVVPWLCVVDGGGADGGGE